MALINADELAKSYKLTTLKKIPAKDINDTDLMEISIERENPKYYKTSAIEVGEYAKRIADYISKDEHDARIVDGIAIIDKGKIFRENPLKALSVNITAVQEGSGDPSPENERPISGWTGAKIVDDSVYGGFINWNQLANINYTTAEKTSEGITYSAVGDGGVNISGTATNIIAITNVGTASVIANHIYYCGLSGYIPHTIGDLFMVSSWNQTFMYEKITKASKTVSGTVNLRFDRNAVVPSKKYYPQLFDLTQMFGQTMADYIYSLEKETPGAGVEFFRKLFPHDYYDYNNGEITNVSAVNDDTDKYELYNIDWEDEAGTVYGALVDLKNGLLTVTHVCDRITTISSITGEGKGASFYLSQLANSHLISVNDLKCNCLKPSNYKDSFDNHVHFANTSICSLRFADVIGTTVAEWETYLDEHPLYICYKIETPITYQLTPVEVMALVGQNNIFANCGDVTECKYTMI